MARLSAISKCYDTTTGEVSQRQVTATFERRSDHLNYLTIIDATGKEQTLETTDGHPFWVVSDNPDLNRAAREVVDENGVILYHENLEPGLNGYWVEAKDLKVGDVFLGANGELSTLANIVRVEQEGEIAVFNFSVEGNHNYFVLAKEYSYGQTCVLVHNAVTFLYRNGLGKHKLDEIAEQCQAAKNSAKVKNIHGISVSETVPSKPARSAPQSQVKEQFTVHDTPLHWDKGHKTVEFPEPVTPESVKAFYDLFRP